MESKVWTVLNWIFLVFVTFSVVWFFWGYQFKEDTGVMNSSIPSGDCVDIEKLEGIEYEACFDAYSETIFLKASRERDNYRIKEFDVSFVDIASKSYVLKDVPSIDKDGAYKLLAKKNPKNIDIKLNVVKDFSGDACKGKGLFVSYCPTGISGKGVNVSINPIAGVGVKDFVEIDNLPDFDSDVVAMDLVEKEKIWESTCKSDWDCGEWESCDEGIQRRDCSDSSGCFVPINSPVTVQKCDGSCVENWECEWGDCRDGVSAPVCNDLNSCGTSYDVPDKLPCENVGECIPNVICGDWSKCEVDYNFMDLIGREKLVQLNGSQSRVCVDKKDCINNQKEERVCSVGVDIYTERFERCGQGYIGVYDVLDDSTLAILKIGKGGGSYLDIYFDEQDNVYCDYCFDGIMNGDEENVDCGGSCKSCESVVHKEKPWWDFLW